VFCYCFCTLLLYAVSDGVLRAVVSAERQFLVPSRPTIDRISGCTDGALGSVNSTGLCPTEGGVLLHLYGSSFFQSKIVVQVGGLVCTGATVLSRSHLTCTLPIGKGGLSPVTVTSLAQVSDPNQLLQYGRRVR
jgi:hypothetical protein